MGSPFWGLESDISPLEEGCANVHVRWGRSIELSAERVRHVR